MFDHIPCAGGRAFAVRMGARSLVVAMLAWLMLALPAAAQTDVIDTILDEVDATALATDADGVLHFATEGRIWRLAADGTRVAVAGTGVPGFAGDAGPALEARIGRVAAMDFLSTGALVFVDADANRVRQLDGGIVTTIAGNGGTTHSGDGDPAVDAGFEPLTGLAVGDADVVYVSTGHRIRAISGGLVSTFVNVAGETGTVPDYSPPADFRIDSPESLAFKDGFLYFSDTGNARVVRASQWSAIVVVGSESNPGDYAGHALALDASYRIVVTQPGRHWVRAFGGYPVAPTVAGKRDLAGFSGDGGEAAAALLSAPGAVAVHGDVLYVADTGNRRIRRIGAPVLPTPAAPVAEPWYGAAKVRVSAPADPSWTTLREFQVTTDTSQAWGYWTVLPHEANGKELSGLTNGTPYRFHVRVAYEDGSFGPWSAASNEIVPVLKQIPTFADASVVEGDSGTRDMLFTVSVPEPAGLDVAFSFSATLTSTAGPDDFVETVLETVIPKGQTQVQVAVPVKGDNLVEEDEQFLAFLGHDGFSAGHATGTILDDDGDNPPVPLAATPDRFFTVARPNHAGDVVDVVANDVFVAGSLAGGRLELASLPANGEAALVPGEAGTAADDRITYTPDAGFSGEDAFTYRLCDGAGQCALGTATFRVNLFAPPRTVAGHVSGWTTAAEASRTLADLRIEPTPMRSLPLSSLPLAGDPTPHTPWDAGGTAVRHFVLPVDDEAVRWRAYAGSAALWGMDVTLYVGVDADGDGQAEEAELRCVVDVDEFRDACEVDIDVPALAQRGWWVLAQNRDIDSNTVPLLAGAAPLVPGDGTLMAAGPGNVAAGDPYRIWSSYNHPGLAEGEFGIGFLRVLSGTTLVDVVPVTAEYAAGYNGALPLRAGVDQALRVAAGRAREAMFIDVPEGASALTVTVHSDHHVELYLGRATLAPPAPYIGSAPERSQAFRSAVGVDGEAMLTLAGAELTPGRWFITPVNKGDGTAAMIVNAAVTGIAPVVRPGSYFHANRSGHGIFLYPAADQIAGLWYTYRDAGKPTWYYLQAAKPGANGLWTSDIYQSTWLGDRNVQSMVGRATVTPTGPDAFAFTYQLHGASGSEPMAALGRGCPLMGGLPVDTSSHWFDPATAGTGYSVQFWENYEYYAAFVYDDQGVARYLAAELPAFGGADATIPLEQLTGFCPTCTRTGAPARQAIGTLRRIVADGELQRIVVGATFVGDVPGVWTGDDDVQALGGPGTTQGCEP